MSVFLAIAALCQLGIVFLCVRAFIVVLVRRVDDKAGDAALWFYHPGSFRASIPMLHAAFLNCALLLMLLPAIAAGSIGRGLLILYGFAFLTFGISTITVALTHKARLPLLETALSAVGCMCLLVPYYLGMGA